MDTLPTELIDQICSYLPEKHVARLGMTCKHVKEYVYTKATYSKLTIYSHVWSSMKLWLQKVKPQCDRVVVINNDLRLSDTTFFDEVFDCIDTSCVKQLVIYDMSSVNMYNIFNKFQNLVYLKLYRPYKIVGPSCNQLKNLKVLKVQHTHNDDYIDDMLHKAIPSINVTIDISN